MINLKQQDSISFFYLLFLSGTTVELAINVKFGNNNDFIIHIFSNYW